MGTKLSKGRAKGSSVVMIVRAGGKREVYSRPVSAQEIMLRYPQHVLTHLDVKDADFRKSIITPESVLLPGMKYFLVPRRTVEWLLAYHSDLTITLGDITGSIAYPSDSDNGTDNSSKDSITATPQRSTDEQSYPEKLWIGRVKLPKSPRPIEINPRPWRSSPKVCPGDQYSLGDEQLSDLTMSCLGLAGAVREYDDKLVASPQEDQHHLKPIEGKCGTTYHVSELPHNSRESMKSPSHIRSPDVLLQQSILLKDQTSDALEEKVGQEACCLTSLDGCASIHLKTSPPGGAVASHHLSNFDIQIDAHGLSQREADMCLHGPSMFSGKEPQKRSLLELLQCPDLNVLKPLVEEWQCNSALAQTVAKGPNETSKMHVVEVPLVECLESNDFRPDFTFQDLANAHAWPLKAEVNEVITANKQQPSHSPLVESVEHQICVTASHTVALATTSCLHQENIQHGDLQVNLCRENIGQEGLEEASTGESSRTVQLYGKAEDAKDNTRSEAPHVRDELDASVCNDEAASVFQPRDQGDNPAKWHLPKILLDDPRQDDEREGCGRQDHLTEGCAYIPNVTIPPIVAVCKEPVVPCSLEDQEMPPPVCPDRQTMNVDGSDAENSTKELNLPRGQTLGDIFLRRSPDYLELINAGRSIDGMPPLSASSPPPSSFSLGASLSVLMKIDAPNIRRLDSFTFAANWQENLTLLGFQSIGGDSLSIYGQAKAHTRANLVMGQPPLGAFTRPLPEIVQRRGSHHFVQQENVQLREARMPSTPTPQRFPRPCRRRLLWLPRGKPLSPIIELSPELSCNTFSTK